MIFKEKSNFLRTKIVAYCKIKTITMKNEDPRLSSLSYSKLDNNWKQRENTFRELILQSKQIEEAFRRRPIGWPKFKRQNNVKIKWKLTTVESYCFREIKLQSKTFKKRNRQTKKKSNGMILTSIRVRWWWLMKYEVTF